MKPHAADRALVRRLLGGSEKAFDELVEVYAQRVYRFALARLGDPDGAADVVQSTLASAIPKLAGYRGEASLTTWLCGFARYEVQAVARSRRRAPRSAGLVEDLPLVSAALELLEEEGDDPERRALSAELGRLVQALLDRLPARYGDVLEWKYVEGLSVREIAARLETTRVAAQSILARARRAFRDGFDEIAVAHSLSGRGRALGGEES